MAPLKFALFDVVELKAIRVPLDQLGSFNRRRPRIGDVATIVEVYQDPPGYELECSDGNGMTEWLLAFSPDAVELELVH